MDALRFAANLDVLVDHHEPLARLLRRRRAQGLIGRCADLFGLDWEGLITQRHGARSVGAPRAVTGRNATERAQRYAAQLRDRLAALFPAEALADTLGREGDPADAAAQRFLRHNPALDLAGAGVERYLAAHAQALAAVPEDERQSLVERLKRWRRLLQLTDGLPGQVALVRRLLALGLDSAQAIASIGAAALHVGARCAYRGQADGASTACAGQPARDHGAGAAVQLQSAVRSGTGRGDRRRRGHKCRLAGGP